MIIPAGVLVHRATRPLRGTVAVLFVSRVVVAGRVVDTLCGCVSIQLTLSQESVDSTDPFARKCVDSTNASQESPKEVPGTVPVLFTCTVRVPVPVKRPGGSRDTHRHCVDSFPRLATCLQDGPFGSIQSCSCSSCCPDHMPTVSNRVALFAVFVCHHLASCAVNTHQRQHQRVQLPQRAPIGCTTTQLRGLVVQSKR